jgi:hypothetical protein
MQHQTITFVTCTKPGALLQMPGQALGKHQLTPTVCQRLLLQQLMCTLQQLRCLPAASSSCPQSLSSSSALSFLIFWLPEGAECYWLATAFLAQRLAFFAELGLLTFCFLQGIRKRYSSNMFC